MDLWKHFLASVILATIFFPIYKYYSLLIFVGGFLIDADHILYYWIKKRKIELDPGKIKAFYKAITTRQQYKEAIRIFHNVEFLILMFFICIPLAIGMGVHLMMDMYEEKNRFGAIENYVLTFVVARIMKK